MIDLQKLERDLIIKPSLLSEAEQAAGSAYRRARALPCIGAGIDHIWADARSEAMKVYRAASGATELHRSALMYRSNLEIIALLSDLLSIASAVDLSRNPLAMSAGAGQQMIANSAAARELLNSRPATKVWLAKRDAAMAAADEAQQAAQEQQVKDAPRQFLEYVRARGVHPELSENGSIVVPPGTNTSKLLPTELRALTDWKAELVALLQAEADMAEVMGSARPMVLA